MLEQVLAKVLLRYERKEPPIAPAMVFRFFLSSVNRECTWRCLTSRPSIPVARQTDYSGCIRTWASCNSVNIETQRGMITYYYVESGKTLLKA